jgi:hypothetical protein
VAVVDAARLLYVEVLADGTGLTTVDGKTAHDLDPDPLEALAMQ